MPRRTSPRQLDLFLRHLARSGNIALAAADSGLARSGLHKRRARSPAFAARWDNALATFLSSPETGGEGNRPSKPDGKEASSSYLTALGDLTLLDARRHRLPQLRRSPAGRLTPAGLAAFLAALETTANVRLSAATVGVAASSIYARRRRDQDFARAMDAALDTGAMHIEAALIEAAALMLDPGGLDEAAPGEHPVSPFPDMTVDGALHLLRFHHPSRRGRVGRHMVPESSLNARSRLTDDEVLEQLIPKLRALGRRAAAKREAAAAKGDGSASSA